MEMARVLLEDLNAPWIEPSKKASKEITQLLNAVPSAERRRRTTPSSRKKSATMVQRRSNNDSQKKSAGAAKTRPLEAWAPSKEEERFRVEGLGKKKKGSKKYDQFDANKKLGVKTQSLPQKKRGWG